MNWHWTREGDLAVLRTASSRLVYTEEKLRRMLAITKERRFAIAEADWQEQVDKLTEGLKLFQE
jgi:predicted site-specific integrase-resolvase